MNSQEKRRAARAEKQSAWKQANPVLVGVKATPVRQMLTLNRQAMSRIDKAVETETEYRKQILAAASKYTGPDIESGSVCLPQVAAFNAGHRKSESVTAR